MVRENIDKTLSSVALSFEDRLKITPWLAFVGGVRFEHLSLDSSRELRPGPTFNFSKSWDPVSYRAAVTLEPVRNLMFYAMTATAYDPAAAGIFSVADRAPGSLDLASARIYEAGVKYLSPDNTAEFTLSTYNLLRKNVFILLTNTTGTVAGEIASKGIELAVAWRPIDGLKLWGNVGTVTARFNEFLFNGNEPSNIAPIVANAGAAYRWGNLRFPVEIGGSVRHVGNRFLSEDNLTTMNAYTTADLYAFVDVPGREWGQPENNLRIGFRVRNVTDRVYAAYSDSGYPDQFYLGAPRTYELSGSVKF
jgi:iron complex outermembrane receptor protein